MTDPIDWRTIARPLDVSQAPGSVHHVRRWTSLEEDAQGVTFACRTAAGEQAEFRLDVVAPDIVRVRMGPPGRIAQRNRRPSDLLAFDPLPQATFALTRVGPDIHISTDRLRLEVAAEPWQWRAFDVHQPAALPFFAERIDDRNYGPGYEVAPVGFEIAGDGLCNVRETVAVAPGEAFYGFGERFTAFDKWGQEFSAWAMDCGNVSSPRAYKNVPFFLSTAGYGLFVHSTCPIVYRMGSQSSISYSFHVAEDVLDYFLIYGPAFTTILQRYAGLTGRATVPPKWSFGYWQSRAGYRSRAEVESVAAELRRRAFPCDVISLDPWWMGQPPWSTYSWDETCFPDPRGMIASLREQGIRTCLWIHPYLPRGSALYEEGVRLGYFLHSAAASPAAPPEAQVSYALEAFSGDRLAPIDFTNPAAVAWFQAQLERLLDDGVAVFKSDFGEQAPVDARYHDGRTGLEMHNLYPLLYNKAVFEVTERRFGRGLTWARAGYAGSQRYPLQWGGDSYASLDQMAGQLRGLLSYGMSGVTFCSHDVGGFDYAPGHFDAHPNMALHDTYGGEPCEDQDPVVYIRWLQFGVFSSHVRGHGKPPREPWHFGPTAEDIARRYLNLRYRLLPYIYTQAVASARAGLPMVRPMVLMHQSDPTTRQLDRQYLFGDDFLVAPVLRRDGRVEVYLPAGVWFDFWTKEPVVGPRWLSYTAPLDTLPLWVRGGALIPFGPEMRYVDERPLDPLVVELYGPGEEGRLVIYDEDRPDILVTYRRDGRRSIVFDAHDAPGHVTYSVYE